MVNRLGMFAGFLLLIVSMLVFVPTSNAFEYYTNSSTFFYQDTAWTDPYSPRVDCNADASACVMLTYEDNILFRGVKIQYSTDLFLTHQDVRTLSQDYSGCIGYRSYFNLPYDVRYNADINKFFVVSKDLVYVVNIDGNDFFNTTIQNASCVENPQVLGMINDTHAMYVCVDNAGNYEYKYYVDLMNNGVQTQFGHPTIPANVGNLEEMRGFVTQDASGNIKYDYYFKDSGGDENTWTGDNINFPYDYQGLHFYTGGNLYYKRAENATGNISEGIWLIPTSDFSSYGTSQLKYPLDTSIAETVNESWGSSSGSSKTFLAWARYSNSTENGVYFNTEDNNRFRFQTHSIDEYGNMKYVNATVYLDCDIDSTSGTTNSIGILDLYSPCETGINITVISNDAEYYPTTYNTYNLTHLTDGEVPTIFQFWFVNDLEILVKAVDQYTLESLSGVNVSIGDNYNATGADGITRITIQPYISPDFEMTTGSTSYTFNVDKEARGFDIYASIANYNSYSETGKAFVSFYDNGTIIYDNYMLVELLPISTALTVRLWTSDLKELFPTTGSNLTVSGGNGTVWVYEGTYFNTSTATGFPSTFLFNNQVDPTNITMSLIYSGVAYPEEYVDVVKDESNFYDFFLNFTSNEIPCNSIEDCPSSECVGTGFEELVSCTESTCIYETNTCSSPLFCDDLVGCYDLYGGSSCTSDNQCESYCLNNYTMYIGYCGSENTCLYKLRDCTQYCNTSIGICEEIKLCQEGQEIQFKIWFNYGDEQKIFKVYDDTARCDLDVADSSFCIPAQTIPRTLLTQYGVTINNIRFIQPDWKYATTSSGSNVYYNFSAISISCSDSCQISYQFCDYGCDDDTGQCVGSPNNLDTVIKSMLPEYLQWLLTATFLWALLCLIVGAVLTYIPAIISNHAQPTPEYGLASMFVLFIIGLFLGFVEPIIGLIIIIGLGLALTRMLSSLIGGNN